MEMKHNVAAVNQNIQQNPLSLKPRMHKEIRDFLQDEKEIYNLVNSFGSPLNVMFPQMINENIQSFQDIYKKHHCRGRIYFTTKPNKSLAVVKQAALQDVGVDVSSQEALKVSMGCGFHPSRIECTGPKNLDYLNLAIQQNTTINADNFDELKQILQIRNTLGIKNKTRLFVRLSGFHSPRLKFTSQDSTFGISVNYINDVFEFLLAYKDELDFQGFSFHFIVQSPEQKIIAIETLIKYSIEASKKGLSPKGINIGGGFDINYAESKEEWLSYVDTLKNSLRNYDQSLSWNNSGLGFRNEGGLIKGAPNFMPHFFDYPGAEGLDFYLSRPMAGFDNMTFAQILNDCLLELYIEPGRSLLVQLGITVGRVNFTKLSAHGETLIGLDMNRNNMHSTQQKLLTDPIIIYQDKSKRRACTEGVYYIGNLCLAYDMITYNKTFPDYLPEQGDLVMFINTAPYIMDFVESNTLHQKIAKKVAIAKTDSGYQWYEDENYEPALLALRERNAL